VHESLPQVATFLIWQVRAAYEDHAFPRVLSLLQQLAVSDLSNFYLDVAKDRLYISAPEQPRRRSCQTVLSDVIHTLAAALAPILPHLAEDIWLALPYVGELDLVARRGRLGSSATSLTRVRYAAPCASVFEAGWAEPAYPLDHAGSAGEWSALRALRDAVRRGHFCKGRRPLSTERVGEVRRGGLVSARILTFYGLTRVR
jgi:isoleucyl-tRNA synthetase